MATRKPLPIEYSSLVPPLPQDIVKQTALVRPLNQPNGVYAVAGSSDVEVRFQIPTRLGFFRPQNTRLQFVLTNTSTDGNDAAVAVKSMGHHVISGIRISQGVNVLREYNFCPEGYSILWDTSKANYASSEGSIMAGQSLPSRTQGDAADPGYLDAEASRDFVLLLPSAVLCYLEQLVPMPLLNAPMDILIRLNSATRVLSPTAADTTLSYKLTDVAMVFEVLQFPPTWTASLASATRVAPLRFYSKEVIFFSDNLPTIANGTVQEVQLVIPVRAPLVSLQHAFFKRGPNTAVGSQNTRRTYRAGLQRYDYQLGTIRYPSEPIVVGGVYASRAFYKVRMATGVGNDVVRATFIANGTNWAKDNVAADLRSVFQFGEDFSVVAAENRRVLGNSFPANKVADQLTLSMWFAPSVDEPMTGLVCVTAATVETMYELRGDGSIVRVI